MDALGHMRVPATFFQARLGLGKAQAFNLAINKLAATFLREPELLYEKELLSAVRGFQPTLVLVIQGSQLSPKTLAKLRTVTQAPMACWCQDPLIALGRQFMLAAGYDTVFVKDRYMQDVFSRMIRSTTFRYLPEACNPRVHRPIDLSAADQAAYGCEVMIAGTLYYYRQEILRQISEFDLRVWGARPGWLLFRLAGRHGGRAVVMEEKAKAMRAARICLNTLNFSEVNGMNCRAFEIAGCGGFQLMSSVPVITEHFDPGVELVTFDSVDDLRGKIRHYLDNPQQAAQIALRGQQRAHRDHTYEARLGEILRICAES
ncbi:MAG TPA: glycosyltransferase [Steroidobacteraceae bacterium]|nr:glycosyltransferase [Steroidobacteraceae bacterium]